MTAPTSAELLERLRANPRFVAAKPAIVGHQKFDATGKRAA